MRVKVRLPWVGWYLHEEILDPSSIAAVVGSLRKVLTAMGPYPTVEVKGFAEGEFGAMVVALRGRLEVVGGLEGLLWALLVGQEPAR